MNALLRFDPTAFRIFGYEVKWYGVIIGIAMFIGITLASREMKRKGFDEDFVLDAMMWVIPIGFIGARLYYVIFEWEYYRQHLGEIWAIWQGGIAIYGGLLAGGATLIIYTLNKFYPVWFTLDVIAPSVLLAQAMGRWGNFMNQEAHGGEISRAFLEGLFLPNFIIEQMNIDGIYYQPTFLYESLWSLIGFAILIYLRYKDNSVIEGEIALLYLTWYSFGRFFIEGLRTDSLYWGPFRVSQVLALILFVVCLGIIIYRRRLKPQPKYYSDIIGPELRKTVKKG